MLFFIGARICIKLNKKMYLINRQYIITELCSLKFILPQKRKTKPNDEKITLAINRLDYFVTPWDSHKSHANRVDSNRFDLIWLDWQRWVCSLQFDYYWHSARESQANDKCFEMWPLPCQVFLCDKLFSAVMFKLSNILMHCLPVEINKNLNSKRLMRAF